MASETAMAAILTIIISLTPEPVFPDPNAKTKVVQTQRKYDNMEECEADKEYAATMARMEYNTGTEYAIRQEPTTECMTMKEMRERNRAKTQKSDPFGDMIGLMTRKR